MQMDAWIGHGARRYSICHGARRYSSNDLMLGGRSKYVVVKATAAAME